MAQTLLFEITVRIRTTEDEQFLTRISTGQIISRKEHARILLKIVQGVANL